MAGEDEMSSSRQKQQDSPFGLLRYATEYVTVGRDSLDAYRSRQHHTQQHHTRVPFAIYYNFLHGVELGLKAYILNENAATLDELRSRKFGHNLEAAMKLAVEYKLREKCPTFTDVHHDQICAANAIYSSKEFEYISIGKVQLPHIDQIGPGAESLVGDLTKIAMRALPGEAS